MFFYFYLTLKKASVFRRSYISMNDFSLTYVGILDNWVITEGKLKTVLDKKDCFLDF